MKFFRVNSVILVLCVLMALQLKSQELMPGNDSIQAARKEKNFRFSILGGPGYTPDFGFLIGGSTLVTFSTDPSDLTLHRSVVPMAFAFTFGNGLGFSIASRPQLFLNHDKFRISGQFIFKMTGDNYYGVGYDTNNETQRGELTTLFQSKSFLFNPVFLFRIKSSDFFAGPVINYTYDSMEEPSAGVQNDLVFIEQGGDSTGYKAVEGGAGINVSYDTRDVPSNAYSGIYLDFRSGINPSFLGTNSTTGLINIDYRQYVSLKKLGERRVLAWSVNSKNSFGNVPLTRLPFLGSPFDLRGYYQGQYRDKSTHFLLAEYRHMINTDMTGFWSKLAGRMGFAAWTGIGFMGPKITKVEGVLPNYGAGLRIELQPRMNFRFDVGRSPLEGQTLIYFNMTESF